MKEAVWLFVAVIALVISVPTIWLGALQGRIDSSSGAVGSGFGLVLWAVWTLQAWNVKTVTQSGEVVAHSYPSLGYLGAVAACLMLYSLIKATITALDERGSPI